MIDWMEIAREEGHYPFADPAGDCINASYWVGDEGRVTGMSASLVSDLTEDAWRNVLRENRAILEASL